MLDTQIAFLERVRFDQFRFGELVEGLQVLAYTAPRLFCSTLIVTSVRDGEHKVGSAHYVAGAFDARILGYRTGGIVNEEVSTGLSWHDFDEGNEWQRGECGLWVKRAELVLPDWQFMLNTNRNGIHAEIDAHGRVRAEAR